MKTLFILLIMNFMSNEKPKVIYTEEITITTLEDGIVTARIEEYDLEIKVPLTFKIKDKEFNKSSKKLKKI